MRSENEAAGLRAGRPTVYRNQFVAAVVCAALGPACSGPAPVPPADETSREATTFEWRRLDPPASDRSLAPNLAIAGSQVVHTWLERYDGGEGVDTHRLLFSRLTDTWTKPVVIAEGDDFFANWADLPAVVAAADGSLTAHWLAKTSEETYAYSIFLARSTDGGLSWTPLGRLNDDDTPTEHGFVSYIADGDGVRAFWLDGRGMAEGGPMSLRTALIGSRVGADEVLDERVCECCSTGSAMTSAGPVVVSRDRSESETRDISIVLRADGGWGRPRVIHQDGWQIDGCPVNGPEIAAAGDVVAVAWFTAANAEPKVQVAFSHDAGLSFGRPVLIDGGGPLGRVDIVLDGREAVVSWLAFGAEMGEVRLRRIAADGTSGPPVTVARTAASRAAGFPRLVRNGDLLYLAWVDVGDEGTSNIRLREIPVASVPNS
ncbi:MAG: hypothetical protein EP299_04175 [Acidobacteria bacterium]|nr:MAG: hypothetical protein EP299_04175 [Acidobacteriota bacterium]